MFFKRSCDECFLLLWLVFSLMKLKFDEVKFKFKVHAFINVT